MQTLSIEKLKEHYVRVLHQTARDKGLNSDGVNVLEKIMHVESSDNLFAQNGKSSAKGLFQPIDGTWNDYVNKHKGELTIDGRYDPIQQMKFAVYFTLNNQKSLGSSLGKRPTSGELYLAHFLGDNGAISVIKEARDRPNTKIKGFLSQKVIDSNSEVFFKMNGNKGLSFDEFTVGDLANWANAKMEQKPSYVTNSEPHYKRNKLGIPEVMGDMTMVAIVGIVAAAAIAIGNIIFGDDDEVKAPSTPRKTPPRSRA